MTDKYISSRFDSSSILSMTVQSVKSSQLSTQKISIALPIQFTKRPKQVKVDIGEYIEDYVLANYFKLYTLLPFQRKSIIYLITT